MSFLYREPIKLLADVLTNQLSVIAPKPHIYLSNQKIDIDQVKLNIVLGYAGPGKMVFNGSFFDATGTNEVQECIVNHLVQIDLLAFDDTSGKNAARINKEIVLMALQSYYSQGLQEQYACRIGKMPMADFVDTSSLEGTAMLTRYTATVMITVLSQNVVPAAYYGVFPVSQVSVNP